jgi:hypothetical protein
MLKTGKIISTLMCLSSVLFAHVSFATVAGTSAPGISYVITNVIVPHAVVVTFKRIGANDM